MRANKTLEYCSYFLNYNTAQTQQKKNLIQRKRLNPQNIVSMQES